MYNLKKKNLKIGILGGTFDPPHAGHLHISKIGIKKFKLNKLFWIIAKKNPLKKKPFLERKIRINLAKQITEKEKKITVKYLDKKIKSSDTFKILSYFRKKNKDMKIYFFIGADNLIKFHKWNNWKQIPKLAKLVVFARKNYTNKAFSSIASKKLLKNDWIYVDSKKIDISSSLIRKFW